MTPTEHIIKMAHTCLNSSACHPPALLVLHPSTTKPGQARKTKQRQKYALNITYHVEYESCYHVPWCGSLAKLHARCTTLYARNWLIHQKSSGEGTTKQQIYRKKREHKCFALGNMLPVACTQTPSCGKRDRIFLAAHARTKNKARHKTMIIMLLSYKTARHVSNTYMCLDRSQATHSITKPHCVRMAAASFGRPNPQVTLRKT